MIKKFFDWLKNFFSPQVVKVPAKKAPVKKPAAKKPAVKKTAGGRKPRATKTAKK
jgi:sec-independent protein translocase protein TatB